MLWTVVQSLKKVQVQNGNVCKLGVTAFSFLSTGITIHVLDWIHYKNKK